MSIDDVLIRSVREPRLRPVRLARPATEAECSDEVVRAAADRLAVVPLGGATAAEQGNALRSEAFVLLHTGAMAGIVDYSAPDMVVTARAGTTLASLQARLSRDGQYLPIDCPRPDEATLGGIVATNRQGLWQGAFGAPRDRLLALRAVLADGCVARAGAKVVKNVAGYDLCKLLAGSWGTLGVITEVTFKTSPLPEARAHASYAADAAEHAAAAALRLHTEHLDPAYMVVAGGPPWSLCVGLMGGVDAVAWQRAEVERILLLAGLRPDVNGPSEERVRDAIACSTAPIVARMSLRPSDLPAVASALEGRSAAMSLGVAAGIAEAAFEGTDAELRGVPALVRAVMPAGGRLRWTRIRVPWADEIDVWDGIPNGWALMRGLKAALDPTGVFSPGRFVGGL